MTFDEMWEKLEAEDDTGFYKQARHMATLVNNIERLIREKRIKKKDVAKCLRVSPQYINAVLHCQRQVRTMWIMPLCELLDCSPNELFGWESKE